MRNMHPKGGEAIAPEILLGLLFYGYATGLFSSRKIEKATYESIPFRYIAGGLKSPAQRGKSAKADSQAAGSSQPLAWGRP